jgi:hypothetical protein
MLEKIAECFFFIVRIACKIRLEKGKRWERLVARLGGKRK